jgi:Pyruvate/2-oxoacid:ferredoxin oxidoreductase delta subunit
MSLKNNLESGGHTEVASPPSSSETSRVIIHADLCKACGLCIAFCPKGVLEKGTHINMLGFEATEYTGKGCTGCGTCYYVCPEPGAVTVVRKRRS